MAQACPLSFVTIDGTIARINSFWTALFLVAYYFSEEVAILFLLAVDFATRIYISQEYSFIYHLSKLLKGFLHLEAYFTDSGAKRLASKFGLLFIFLLALTQEYNLFLLHSIVFITFISCVFLELIFNYCIGCKIYYIYQTMKLK